MNVRAHLVSLSLALLALPAAAQPGALQGTVLDASTRQPVAEVIVTVTSPKLAQERQVLTDEAGTYRLIGLPPGPYALHFARVDFLPYARRHIQVWGERTFRINVELLPRGVLLCGDYLLPPSPVIDMGSNQTSVTIGQDLLRTLPLPRP